VITIKEALDLGAVPGSAVVIGGGAIGLELATLWSALGAEVSVVERMARLIPGEDRDIAAFMEQILTGDGVRIHTGAEVERIEDVKGGKAVSISGEGRRQRIVAQTVVFALGHRPLVEGLGLENAGVGAAAGSVQTNTRMETDVPGIYSAGDVTGERMLANVAMVQGSVAARNAMGVIPRGIRTFPEIGAVGITEKEAEEKGLEVRIGRYPLMKNAKASMSSEPGGFIKMIADPQSGRILGIHIVGPQATELVHGAMMVMKMGGTVRDIAEAVHGHPCLHEAVQQVAEGMCG
jgi:dihydrolipoamide dehydrogenase